MKPRNANSSQIAGTRAKTPIVTARLGICDITLESESLTTDEIGNSHSTSGLSSLTMGFSARTSATARRMYRGSGQASRKRRAGLRA